MSVIFCTCMRRGVPQARTVVAAANVGHARLFQQSAAIAARARPVPDTRDNIQSPEDFLKTIGRSMVDHQSKVGETWQDLWSKDSDGLKAAGITATKDRKYILRQMNYYRRDRPISEIPAKPKKKFRGRGPRVQKGVRVR